MKNKCAKRASHKIEVVMPYHCSEIQNVLQLNNDMYDDDTSKFSSSNFDDAEHVNPVVVPVLHEGVMWRGLCPLFHLIVQRCENRNEQYKHQQQQQQQQQHSICREKIVYCPSYSRVLKRRRRFFYEWLRRGNSNNNNNAKSLSITAAAARIILLPPYTSSPDFYACSLFITWEHILIRLQSLQAFTSTLGGGYFFCGQLHVAIELARYQRKLALALRDDHAAGICTVNEAYNYIHAGYIQNALDILRRTRSQAIERNDDLLLAMTSSAYRFAKRVRKLYATRPHLITKQQKSPLFYDDYHRIRVL